MIRARRTLAVLGLIGCLLVVPAAVSAHGEGDHSTVEQLPYVLATLLGLGLVAFGAIGEHKGVLTSKRAVNLTIGGGLLLVAVGFVGYQLL